MALVLVSSCAPAIDLELRDITRFSVSERMEKGRTFLKISGLSAHSAYAVDKILTNERGGSLEVSIQLAKADKNKEKSGSFEYDLAVPGTVNSVYLGSARSEIWKRER